MRHFPDLETSRLSLNELHLKDAPFILDLYSNETYVSIPMTRSCFIEQPRTI